MVNNKKLVLDTHCEVYDLLKSAADAEFWNFKHHLESGLLQPGALYLIGRRQMQLHSDQIRSLVENNIISVVFSNPAEGSDTLRDHVAQYGIADLVLSGKILLIGGGDMDQGYRCLQYDSFLPKILDYDQNIKAIDDGKEIYTKIDKPYKFLFLNGRKRTHRQYLLQQFATTGLLAQSIWTCLDQGMGPVKYLDPQYEYSDYQSRVGLESSDQFVKNQLFNHTWGEVYLAAKPYIDTYFSVVTETVFKYPYSFRTEKIWKPIAIGHPFVAVANRGYYRDLHKLGFQTFGHVLDESFDQIDNNDDRLERIARVINDLCQQDLASFLTECYNACKYNQQHLAEMRDKIRKEFPSRFFQFIKTEF